MERPRAIERSRDCDDDLGPPVWKPVSIEEEKTKPKWVQDMGNICAGLYKDYCEISNPFDTTTFFNELEWMRRDADGPQGSASGHRGTSTGSWLLQKLHALAASIGATLTATE
mgnify:CR=1 FL=1